MSASDEAARDERTAVAERPRQAPGVVAPTTRLNLALPFSKITIEEPGKELIELAAIVADLAAAMEPVAREQGLSEVRERADALVTRLRR